MKTIIVFQINYVSSSLPPKMREQNHSSINITLIILATVIIWHKYTELKSNS